MIKHRISEQIFLDALPCETIVAGKTGKIFRSNRDHCKSKNFPPDKNFPGKKIFLDALPCETIAAGKAGKIFRATGLPHNKIFSAKGVDGN